MRTKRLLEQVLQAIDRQQKTLLEIIQDERKERKELIDRFMSRNLPEFKTYSVEPARDKFEVFPPDAEEDLSGEVVEDDFTK